MAPGKADVHAMVTALFTLTAGMERARRKRKAAGTLSLLQLVAGRQPIRPSEIAEVHDVHPSLVTRQVRELEDAGLVQVAADPTVTARAACGSRKCRTAPRMTQTGWLGLMTARRSWLPRTASHPPGNGHTPQARYPCHGQLWDTTSPSRIHRDPGGRPVPRRGSTGKPEPPFRVRLPVSTMMAVSEGINASRPPAADRRVAVPANPRGGDRKGRRPARGYARLPGLVAFNWLAKADIGCLTSRAARRCYPVRSGWASRGSAAMYFACTSGTPFVYFGCTCVRGCGLGRPAILEPGAGQDQAAARRHQRGVSGAEVTGMHVLRRDRLGGLIHDRPGAVTWRWAAPSRPDPACRHVFPEARAWPAGRRATTRTSSPGRSGSTCTTSHFRRDHQRHPGPLCRGPACSARRRNPGYGTGDDHRGRQRRRHRAPAHAGKPALAAA